MGCKLANICDFAKQKIDVASLDISNYISTENMMPNKAGIADAATLPNVVQTQSFKKGDTLVSNIRPYFKKIWYASFEGGCSNDVLVFRAKTNVNPRFLYYVLADDIFFEYATSTAKGTKMPRGDKKAILEYEVPDFSYKEQEKIANVLSALDDKIALNQQINKNLEEQAQAIFKAWFIDFEPWQGERPNSWEEGVLGDYVEIKRGGSPRPIQDYLVDSGLRWLKISDVTALQSPFIIDIKEHIKEDGLNKTVFLKAGALVLSNSATPGIPKILDVDSCIHDGWLYFPKSKLSNEFLYLLFKFIRKDLVQLGNGSVFTNLKTDILKNYPFSMPANNTLSMFGDIVTPLFQSMNNIARENKRLSNLRDALLPRLMSGEIDVSGIEI